MDFTDDTQADDGGDGRESVAKDTRPVARTATLDKPVVDRNPEQSGFAKASDDLADDARTRAEFPWLFDPNRGVRWDFNPIHLRNLAQENTWVGMLVQSITKEVAETPWTITESEGRSETQKRLTTHPEERAPVEKELPDSTAERIYDLLSSPNPDANWQDTVEMWLGDLLEIGSMTAVKAYPRSAYDGDEFVADPETVEPRALQASAPEVWTKDYHDKSGIIDGYWQFDDHKSPGGGDGRRGARGIQDPTYFDKSEVVWDDMTPRSNRRYGMPPTLLVEDFLESLELAIAQEQEYLSRGSIPSGAWVFENWDREQVKEKKQEMQENVAGKPHKSLMFSGQGGDVRFEPMSMNFSELEFTERQKWYARVVASAFQVPTAVVGIEPERVNYNTFQGERENFESNTLGPYLQQLERVINDQFVHPHWGRDYRFEFQPGMSESTRAMISERVRSEFDANLRTRSSAMRKLGVEQPEEMEDGFKDDVVEDSGGDGPFGDVQMSVEKDADDGDSFEADVFRLVAPDDAEYVSEDIIGIGVDFPNDAVYVDWRNEVFEDELENSHVSIYGSVEDLEQATGNTAEPIESLDAMAESELARSVVKSVAVDGESGSGNANSAVRKDEPLRETDEWYQFDVQPSDVEELREEIAGDITALYDEVLGDDEIARIIDRLAADETEKSISALGRRLKELFEESEVVERVERALREGTAEKVRETIESAVEESDESDVDVDIEAIEGQLSERSVGFADDYANQIQDEIRDIVGDGWAGGQNSREIASEIAEQADMERGWMGAERIARQELQVATGRARSRVAEDLGKVEVWSTAGDDRVRPAHDSMDGKWVRAGESFAVEYEDRGVRKEDVPGSSEPGIGCRCVTLLRDRSEVDDSDYAGDGGL